jgi:flagellar motor component MotA
MGSSRWVTGVGLAAGGVLLGNYLEGGHLTAFVHPFTALMVAGPTLAAPLVVAGPLGVGRAVRTLLAGRPGDDLPAASAVFLAGAHGAGASGVLGLVLGLIQVMNNLDDPSALGPGIAVALVAPVYGVALAGSAVAAALQLARRSGPALPGPTATLPVRSSTRAATVGAGTALALAATLVGNYAQGGHLSSLTQPTAALVVFGPVVGAAVATSGVRGTLAAVTALVTPSGPEALTAASATWLAGAAGAAAGGTLAWLVGLVHAMNNLHDPSALGPGIAVAFVGVIYGVTATTGAAVFATALARRVSGAAAEAVAGVSLPFALAASGVSSLTLLSGFLTVLYASAFR